MYKWIEMNKAPKNQLTDLAALTEAAECLRTLAHPHRLRMVEMLLEGTYTVGELAEACGIPSHMASEQLGRMKDRGLLNARRQGRKTYYEIAEPGLKNILECIQKRYG